MVALCNHMFHLFLFGVVLILSRKIQRHRMLQQLTEHYIIYNDVMSYFINSVTILIVLSTTVMSLVHVAKSQGVNPS